LSLFGDITRIPVIVKGGGAFDTLKTAAKLVLNELKKG
jgi:hypothetical protein